MEKKLYKALVYTHKGEERILYNTQYELINSLYEIIKEQTERIKELEQSVENFKGEYNVAIDKHVKSEKYFVKTKRDLEIALSDIKADNAILREKLEKKQSENVASLSWKVKQLETTNGKLLKTINYLIERICDDGSK